MDVFVWRARLDTDLYGVDSRDRTAPKISLRPNSLTEIFVAEPGLFDLHYLVKRWYSRCYCRPALTLWIPGNDHFLILAFLRQRL